MNHRALVTGGAGYIGTHTCVALLEAGWDVVVVDDFSNSHPLAVERVRELASGGLDVVAGSILDAAVLDKAFGTAPVDAVVHLAGRKAVGESVADPLGYYETNVAGTVSLAKAMAVYGVHDLVFSSSCTVYGAPERMPITEATPLAATNPYGRTKQYVESLLGDLARSSDAWRVLSLRYFNPVGAHSSGRIGEDPLGLPNNLMPFIMQVAVGRLERLTVFGDDYDTPDGTAVRDYLHVVDLAEAHLAALRVLPDLAGSTAVNLGTGQGHSVLEVVAAAAEAVGSSIPYLVGPRRPGDVPAVWADPTGAEGLLGWKAVRTLDDMCADHWRWQQANPAGYAST